MGNKKKQDKTKTKSKSSCEEFKLVQVVSVNYRFPIVSNTTSLKDVRKLDNQPKSKSSCEEFKKVSTLLREKEKSVDTFLRKRKMCRHFFEETKNVSTLF